MNDQAKLMSAVVAGYLLGRTKQGKRAIRLAVWLSGGKTGVATVLAQQARVNLEGNAAVAALLEQVRGPLVDAGRKALTSALEQRANALADSLHDRTEALSLPGGEAATDTVKSGAKSAKKAGGKLTGRSADDDEGDDEAEDEADQSDRDSAPESTESTESTEDDRPEPARNGRRSSAADKSGRSTKTASRTGKSASNGGTGRAKRTAEGGTTKRSGSTRTNGRSTAQSRQSGGDTRSRSGSTRRRSGQ